MPIDEPGDALFIGNAGLILFAPYLPSLFDRLGLLTETSNGPRMIGAEAMARGVHLLQYLVDERCDRPEPELVLNKLLCGLPTAQPVAATAVLEETDYHLCDSLIDAVIANWSILGNCSRAMGAGHADRHHRQPSGTRHQLPPDLSLGRADQCHPTGPDDRHGSLTHRSEKFCTGREPGAIAGVSRCRVRDEGG